MLNFQYPARLEMYESANSIEIDADNPTKPETIKRSWKERLFSLPWRPWVKTKVIRVPNYKPAIYRVGNRFIYHPALKAEIMKAVEVGKS